MRIGGDPAALDELAAAGPGQAFTLARSAGWLQRTSGWYRSRSPSSRLDSGRAVAELHALATRIRALDTWVGDVATRLRAADHDSLRTRLLTLGTGHPATRRSAPPTRAMVRGLTGGQLAELAAVPGLPPAWRDPVHRARVRQWLATLEDRIDCTPPEDDPGLLARFVDRLLVDRLSAVTDLHPTRADAIDRLRQEAAGARRLLTHPDLTVLSFDAGDPPTMRVALGDVETATHLAVLVPGTGTGLHSVRTSLEDATALHRHATAGAPADARIATVLDMHPAPPDLGRAIDPTPSRTAGAATAAFLTDLVGPSEGFEPPRTTLVGHSYGALTAARASDGHAVDDLVLLGAPGVGVSHRDELTGARRVWAARATGDPIGFVADLDELVGALPTRWRPQHGPLTDPLVAHGPDPTDPEFGARVLQTAAVGAGIATIAARGHVDYLTPGTTSLDNVARIVAGVRQPTGTRATQTAARGDRQPRPGAVSRAQPPRRDQRGSAAGG